MPTDLETIRTLDRDLVDAYAQRDEARVDCERLRVALQAATRSLEMACENPPEGCGCPGCSLAARRAQTADPTVVAELDRRRNGQWYVKIACPHCGETHTHGGGNGKQPDLGHRVSHCSMGSGYTIVARS